MEKVTFEEVRALFPAGIPLEAIQLCMGDHASADDLRNKLKALADTAMANRQHEAQWLCQRLRQIGAPLADEAIECIAALSATAATPSDEVVRLDERKSVIAIIKARGDLIGGAIQPDRTIAAILADAAQRDAARAALEPQGKDV